MIRIGIDNGTKGAIVALDHRRVAVVQARMPRLNKNPDIREIARVLKMAIDKSGGDVYCILEHAQAFPQQGRSSAFNYGTGYGAVQAALIMLDIPHEIQTPRTWQKAIGLTCPSTVKGKNDRRAWMKQAVIELVKRRLPSLDLTPGQVRKPHDGLADAGAMALAAFDQYPPPIATSIEDEKPQRRGPPRRK